MNLDLVAPFTRVIANSWTKVFEQDLFAKFNQAAAAVVTQLLDEIEKSTVSQGLKDRAHAQAAECLEDARLQIDKTITLTKETLNNEQSVVGWRMSADGTILEALECPCPRWH